MLNNNSPLKRKPNDKILDNAYNAGNIEHENFKTPSIDNGYAEDNLESTYNSEEYFRKQKLHNNIYGIVQGSEYAQYLKKKSPKAELAQIYDYVKTRFNAEFDSKEYTNVEFFTAITEVFDVTFDNLYANIFTMHKEQLISELDNKYAIFKKKGRNPLFALIPFLICFSVLIK